MICAMIYVRNLVLPFLVVFGAFRTQQPAGGGSCPAASSISASAPWRPTAAAESRSAAAGDKPSLAAAEELSWSEKSFEMKFCCILKIISNEDKCTLIHSKNLPFYLKENKIF